MMNHKIKVSAFLFSVLATSLGAKLGSQSTTGTVVVIGWSPTKIVIAVDSRGFDGMGKHRDDICKIVKLDNHSVFTAAGNIIHAGSERVFWDAQKEASAVFKEAQRTDSPRPLKTAARHWGDHMVVRINEALAADPSGSTQMLEDNIFLTGVFLGFEDGSSAMYQVEIVFDPALRQARQKFYTERQRRVLHFAALGRNEIVNEVVQAKTAFATAEQRKWAAAKRNIPWRDWDVRWAIRLVQLTMSYHPHKADVGGAIDALEITGKGIRWVERKSECNP